jgi:acetyl-CoA acyltransferase
MAKTPDIPKGRRAVVVDGVRTSFVKAFSDFLELDTIDLADKAVEALLNKSEVPRDEIDSIVWGGVILPPHAPNIAREIALDLNLPYNVEGHTVTRACASGLQAVTSAVSAVERGDADIVIAGGSDSTSNASVNLPQKVVHALAPYAMGGKSMGPNELLGVLSQLMPITEIIPSVPKIAERTTGEVMGESCERMARRNHVTREEQDEFTVMSHHRAAEAWETGRFDEEVAPVFTGDKWVHTDAIVRADTTEEKLSKLRPVFAKDGTLTAGNSSALTDGASATLIMSEEKAKALGYTPRAAFRSWSYTAVDPSDQLLMGPAIAMPQALDKAGMDMSDIDFVDMHEAFAAQVLCVLKMLDSDAFAQERLGRASKVGAPDFDNLNLHGGSVSLGHPFGATGSRIVNTVANELINSDRETALIGICAAGGIGAGAIMERI